MLSLEDIRRMSTDERGQLHDNLRAKKLQLESGLKVAKKEQKGAWINAMIEGATGLMLAVSFAIVAFQMPHVVLAMTIPLVVAATSVGIMALEQKWGGFTSKKTAQNIIESFLEVAAFAFFLIYYLAPDMLPNARFIGLACIFVAGWLETFPLSSKLGLWASWSLDTFDKRVKFAKEDLAEVEELMGMLKKL